MSGKNSKKYLIYAGIALVVVAVVITAVVLGLNGKLDGIFGNTSGDSKNGEAAMDTPVKPEHYSTKPVVRVSKVEELMEAIEKANREGGNVEIVLANGTYDLDSIYIGGFIIEADNITIRGESKESRDKVILTGDAMSETANVTHIFLVRADNFTCENMTLKNVRYHAIQVAGEVDADGIVVRNVRFMDTYEQMLKVSAYRGAEDVEIYSDDGLIEDCIFEYSAGKAPGYYTCAIDGHRCRNWTVRNNVIKDIVNPGGDMTEPAIHFWNNSSGILIEGNTITNCERGIMVGMGTGTICPDSVIRNNRVETNRDVSIAAENAPNTVIEGNECRTGAGYPNSIEYRWPDTTGVVITGNRTNGKIVARDGATAAKVEDNMILND